MKAFNRFNIHFRQIVQSRTNSLHKLGSVSFSTKSHLNLIVERDSEFVNNVISNPNNYSQTDFSNFLRVVNKTRNEKLVEVFAKELPKHISKLDLMDVRKVISIVIENSYLQEQADLMRSIKSRLAELNIANEFELKKDIFDFSHFPLSLRFWAGFANLREIMYSYIRSKGLNLK
jgi:hypothetical protein